MNVVCRQDINVEYLVFYSYCVCIVVQYDKIFEGLSSLNLYNDITKHIVFIKWIPLEITQYNYTKITKLIF